MQKLQQNNENSCSQEQNSSQLYANNSNPAQNTTTSEPSIVAQAPNTTVQNKTMDKFLMHTMVFEEMLSVLGLSQAAYCRMIGRDRSYFNNVISRSARLPLRHVLELIHEYGREVVDTIYEQALKNLQKRYGSRPIPNPYK